VIGSIAVERAVPIRRYDKLAVNDLAFLQLASIRWWLRVNAWSMIFSENRYPLFEIML
jgi:hypothetical protein